MENVLLQRQQLAAAGASSFTSSAHLHCSSYSHPTSRLWYKRVLHCHKCGISNTQEHAHHDHRKRGHKASATINSSASVAIKINDQPPLESMLNNGATQHTFLEMVDAFYRFTRPLTIIPTVLGITSVSLLAVQSIQDVSLHFALEVVRALIPHVLMNIYIVGINQVIDVEIDKINKPSLPLASGDISLNTGISWTILSAILSFALGELVGSKILTRALLIGFILGTGYSLELPLLRWKKWGLAAATTILLYRTFVVQMCTFLHIQTFVLKRTCNINKPIIFLSVFTCILAAILAIMKDIPDLEGDKAHGIQTFAAQLGPLCVYWSCIHVLMTTYGVAILVGLTSKIMWARVCTIIGHGVAASVLWHHSTKVDLKEKSSVIRIFELICILAYAEFFLIHFVR